MSEWQPIETAPKDGSSVLTFSPNDGYPLIVFWQDEMWLIDWDHDRAYGLEPDDKPTHWMPLPEPPNR